jgi:serine/threonine protein kinase
MARVWTSGVLNSLGVSGPLSIGSRWLSALSSGFEPAADMMITPRIRLLRPVQDVRGGRLWVAEHLGLATHVEVTFASAATDSGAAAEAESFLMQASVTAHINEPHVVRIFEHGDVKGVPFIVTELLEARNLRQRSLHGPASVAEAESVVSQACDALARAHALGLTHGNLRLDCLFSTDVGGEPFLKIAGFGAPPPENPSPYSSPEELLLGTAPDTASDLWALAVSLYELLTTTLPFEAATAAGVTVAICNGQFALPSHYRADLPGSVDSWFAQALATDKHQRFGSAAEFAQSFAQALTGEMVTPRAPAVAPSLEKAFAAPGYAASASHVPLELAPLLEPQADEPPALEAPASSSEPFSSQPLSSQRFSSEPYSEPFGAEQPEGNGNGDGGESKLPNDDSLEMDDGEEEEKTVKWDVPDNWANLVRNGSLDPRTLHGMGGGTGAASSAPPAGAPVTPGHTGVHAAAHAGAYATAHPSTVPEPRATVPSAHARAMAPGLSPLASTLPPPALQPSAYLESPYIASVASALAVPKAGGPESVRMRLPLPRRRLSLSFRAEKTWLAAAAFAAGVAATWFVYEPEPGQPTAEGTNVEEDLANIRTVSVNDLPTVGSDEDLAIIRTSQLPKAEEEVVAVPAPPVARVVPASNPVRSSPPVQRVQALSPAPAAKAPSPKADAPKADAAKADAAKADARSNCNPPYYLDVQGIRRLKAECLNASSGPYGALMNTNAAAKSAAPAPRAKPAPAGKQARANASCTPPYYFDGNIRRIKLECL